MKANKKQINKGFRFIKSYSTYLKRHITSRCAPVDGSPLYSKGFTLIELMVATSLFTIIMLMGVGSLIVSSNSAKAAQKLRIAVDNVNFAMEIMTRELRTGSHFYCGGNMTDPLAVSDCIGSGGVGNIVTFIPQTVDGPQPRVGYYREIRKDLAGNNIEPETYSLKRCENDENHCSDIVSSNVDVQTLNFYVKGSEISDKIQPSIQILMNGLVKTKSGTVPFTLQSMASQRSSEQ